MPPIPRFRPRRLYYQKQQKRFPGIRFHRPAHQTLAVARGRLGLLGLKLNVEHVDRVALLQRRHLLVALKAVRVGLAEARGHEHVARGHERR